jgi:hypothetical protein
MFKFKFEKATKGELFTDLDLLTKLLTPATNRDPSKPIIEEVDGQEEDNYQEDSGDEWFVDQNENNTSDEKEHVTLNTFNYGFAHKKSNVFNKLSVILT